MTSLTPQPSFLTIPSKPNAPISYTFFPSRSPVPTSSTPQKLLVFLNGLGLPASSWLPTISLLHSNANANPSLQPSSQDRACPAILTYDRFSQGLTTSRDPLDGSPGKEAGYGHDFMDIVSDLHLIILEVSQKHLDLTPLRRTYRGSKNTPSDAPEDGGPKEEGIIEEHLTGKLELLIVGASIGVPLSRLYAQEYRNTVTGIIALDSNIANTAYSDIIPSPRSPSFDLALLNGECTIEQYTHHRQTLCTMFDFTTKNAENLDRRNSPLLLPHSDSPKLIGSEGGKGPAMTVVGHDPETFIQLGQQLLGTPACISRIVNTHWAVYNEGLRQLTDEGRCPPVVIAKGCGHFIQKDDPSLVAGLVEEMLGQCGW